MTEKKYKIIHLCYWEMYGFGIKEYKNEVWELMMRDSRTPVFFGNRKLAKEYLEKLQQTTKQVEP